MNDIILNATTALSIFAVVASTIVAIIAFYLKIRATNKKLGDVDAKFSDTNKEYVLKINIGPTVSGSIETSKSVSVSNTGDISIGGASSTSSLTEPSTSTKEVE